MHSIIFIFLACTPLLSARNWSKEAVLAGSLQFSTPNSSAEAHACLSELHRESREVKVFSQVWEDGIVSYIFHCIGVTDKTYVEFGTQSGVECVTRYWRERYGWRGLMMDGTFADASIGLMKEFITAGSIIPLFQKYKVASHFDLLVVDIDLNTWWVLRAILRGSYRPRVIVTEFNANFRLHEEYVVLYYPESSWDGSCYFGASATAFTHMLHDHGYQLLGSDGVNLFYVRTDIVGHGRFNASVHVEKYIKKWHSSCNNKYWLRVDHKSPVLSLLREEERGDQRFFMEQAEIRAMLDGWVPYQ